MHFDKPVCCVCKLVHIIPSRHWTEWRCRSGKAPKQNYITGIVTWDEEDLVRCTTQNINGDCKNFIIWNLSLAASVKMILKTLFQVKSP